MAEDDPLHRRTFLRHVAFASGGLYLVEWTWACKEPAPAAPASPPAAPPPAPATAAPHEPPTSDHRTFTNAEWAILVAAVDRVLPKDEDAGGVEAGVPEYIDRGLTDPDLTRMRTDFLNGLNALDRACTRRFGLPFARAKPEEQDTMLRAYATMPSASGEAHFYETLITLCLEGFLGDPSYGGNQNRVGWAMVGFDPGPPMPGMKH
jgi:gluconate 2-dehydrogenase gamma chain